LGWGKVGRIKPPAACLLGPTSSPRSMIRLSSRIGKRYVEVFHVSQAVVRTHGSVVGRLGGFLWSTCVE
jgi:hypothetical protein